MTIKNGDTPATPTTGKISGTNEVWSFQVADGDVFQFPGITKREMIAMHMMAAAQTRDGKPDFQYEAIMAVKAADALLAELDRTK